MIVSFSGIRQFRKCQRQWCFDKIFASALAKKNPVRREVYLLSQLQSIAAWRGNLVDQVISGRVIPALENGWTLKRDAVIAFARSIFDKQFAFAMQNRLHEPGMSKEKGGDSFAALMPIEYGEKISEEKLAQAWLEVKQALMNLFEMNELFKLLRGSNKLIAQRPLIFQHFQVNFRAVPDLIVFFEDRAPLIIDWKVHGRGTQDYRLQLAAYAVALKRCDPRQYFSVSPLRWSVTDMRLLEVQLLTMQQREYQLSEEDICDVDDYIAAAAVQMMMAVNGKSTYEIDPFDFLVTTNPEHCQRCAFRKICSEEVKCQKPEQMTLL